MVDQAGRAVNGLLSPNSAQCRPLPAKAPCKRRGLRWTTSAQYHGAHDDRPDATGCDLADAARVARTRHRGGGRVLHLVRAGRPGGRARVHPAAMSLRQHRQRVRTASGRAAPARPRADAPGWRREYLHAMFGGRCAKCQCHTVLTNRQCPEQATIDHILPIARGGSSELSNMQLLCFGCNHAKGTS